MSLFVLNFRLVMCYSMKDRAAQRRSESQQFGEEKSPIVAFRILCYVSSQLPVRPSSCTIIFYFVLRQNYLFRALRVSIFSTSVKMDWRGSLFRCHPSTN